MWCATRFAKNKTLRDVWSIYLNNGVPLFNCHPLMVVWCHTDMRAACRLIYLKKPGVWFFSQSKSFIICSAACSDSFIILHSIPTANSRDEWDKFVFQFYYRRGEANLRKRAFQATQWWFYGRTPEPRSVFIMIDDLLGWFKTVKGIWAYLCSSNYFLQLPRLQSYCSGAH